MTERELRRTTKRDYDVSNKNNENNIEKTFLSEWCCV